jgi:S-adenosylmethionine decarboxylase proenzyme
MGDGRHLILDLYGCNPEVLDDFDLLKRELERALLISGARILRVIGEKFEPQGVTLLALLAESHASIHTWPCEQYAAVDLYTCGDTKTHEAAVYLKNTLQSTTVEEKEIKRSITTENLYTGLTV